MKKKVEAVLFVYGGPLSLKKMASMLKTSRSNVKDALSLLSNEYAERETAVEIVHTVQDEYVMQLKPEYSDLIKYIPSKKSKAILKTLSLIALRQPIKQSKIVKMRGNHAYRHIKKLADDKLIAKKPKGRTYLLTTTTKFAEYYGLKNDSVEETKKFIRKRIEEAE
ncbi:MAG: SMC-Scp complex subunit ScpB [Euryarchaeota archaeon]|nr:SMC-Scp complex subunit ScpB [Euryarchaeota archaeon]